MKSIVLVSTGRTGTRALAHYWNRAYPDVTALHEPVPSRNLRRLSNRYLCKKADLDTLTRELARSRRKLLASIKTSMYIESNPFLHGCLDAFDVVFDQPLVVHIVRDLRTYVRSYLNWGALRGLKGFAADYYPFWMLKPEMYEERPTKCWREMEPVERIAWRWTTINRELNRGEAIFGQRYTRVRFEDLFAHDGEELRCLADWLGLPPCDEVIDSMRTEPVNVSRDRGLPRFENWSPEDQERLLSFGGELMQMYAYSEASR